MAPGSTGKDAARVARNRANAEASTGPGTAVGKARSSRNATTRGRNARAPADEVAVAERDRRALERALALESDVEAALVDRLAAALQRLGKADHLEARLFDGACRIGDVPPGMRLYRRTDRRRTPAVPGRDRATAAGAASARPRTPEDRRGARRRGEEGELENAARALDSAIASTS